MKIALVGPVEEAIPPKTYGGVESVVHLLDRELARRGHDVVLLASGGSESAGRLIPLSDAPIITNGRDLSADYVTVRKEAAAQRAASSIADLLPDIVLNHSWRLLEHLNAPQFPVLTTIHYPLDVDPYRTIFLSRQHWSYVSVSWSQQRTADSLRFAGNIYNGVDLASLPYSSESDGYLAFLGRISPDKGVDIAIRVAQAVGIPLKIAAKIDGVQRPWFDTVVVPLLRRGGAELVGEVDAAGRARLLGGAMALLHPSRWSEPFGLAAVEAMACGTPVAALRRGAAAEVVEDGATGFVVEDESALVQAIQRVPELSRSACRRHVEDRFSHTRMGAAYETLAIETIA